MKALAPILAITVICSTPSFAKESAEFAQKVAVEHGLTQKQADAVKALLLSSEATRNIGTEDLTEIFGIHNAVHPASRQSCIDKVLKTGLIQQNPQYEKTCGAKWMSPIPGSKVCIDQFEFPNIPCEYPMVWAPASFAKKICGAMGKRVCNSHEWEGGCAGRIDNNNPYRFDLGNLKARRSAYNSAREKVWAYDWAPEFKGHSPRELCAIYSPNDPDMDPRLQGKTSQYYNSIGKSNACQQTNSDYNNCGSHTWPAGMKYKCVSDIGVYDMHGNVAEVVNFPQTEAGLANASGNTDKTERKGAFFVVRGDYPDDCRVRQPYEHFNEFATDKHSFYQEGFRCCKDFE